MKKMKKPAGAILHCTATPNGRKHTVKEIRSWHVEGRGWSDIGYHFVLSVDGEVWAGRPLKYQGAHTKGKNDYIGIAYVGNDEMNDKQEAALRRVLNSLRRVYGKLSLYGHNEFSSKACPGFDVLDKYGYEFCLRDDEATPDVDESEAVVEGPLDEVNDLTIVEELANPDDESIDCETNDDVK